MASIKGLTKAQNVALANVTAGTLILLHQPPPTYHPAHVSESESEDDKDSEGDEGDEGDEEDEDDDEDEGGDGEVAFQGFEPAHQDVPEPASTGPAIVPVARTTINLTDVDRAQHIEDASLFQPVASGSAEYDQHTRRVLRTVAHSVTMVTRVTKDLDGRITEVYIIFLEYSAQPDDSTRSYQLYGNQCVANMPEPAAGSAPSTSTVECPVSIFDNMPEVAFTVTPDAGHIRATLHDGACPAGCDEGFLASIDELHGMVKDYTVPTSKTDVHAICPACVGTDLMKEHQALRAELENFLQVASFESVLEFYSRLAPRRQALGYAFEQFDEREWNFLFDDMLSQEDEGERSDGGYETWEDANDPNGGVVPHPATQAAIDSLQISKYATVKVDDDAQCTVCCEQFKDEQLVVKLPCKHIFCKGECILEWLKNNDSCPLCRAKVSNEADSKAVNRDNEDEEVPDAEEEHEKDHPEEHASMPGALANW